MNVTCKCKRRCRHKCSAVRNVRADVRIRVERDLQRSSRGTSVADPDRAQPILDDHGVSHINLNSWDSQSYRMAGLLYFVQHLPAASALQVIASPASRPTTGTSGAIQWTAPTPPTINGEHVGKFLPRHCTSLKDAYLPVPVNESTFPRKGATPLGR